MKHLRVFRDANHPQIVKDLKAKNYIVIDLAAVGNSVPDILVADAVVTALVEIKLSSGWFYLGQLEFLANWPGIAGFAEETQDVLNLMVEPDQYRLSYDDKEIILKIVADLRADDTRDKKQPRITVSKFNKLFAAAKAEVGK